MLIYLKPKNYYEGTEYERSTEHADVSIDDNGLEFYATDTGILYRVCGGVWLAVSIGSGGAESFLELSDTPATYSGQANKYVKVNAGETALEFVTFVGIPEPDDDATVYGRMTDGTSSWVEVVPASGGEYSGDVGFGITPTVPMHTLGEVRHQFASGNHWIAFTDSGSATSRMAARDPTDTLGQLDISGSALSLRVGSTGIGTNAIRALDVSGTTRIGFFNTTPVARPNAVTARVALQNLGLGSSLTFEGIPEPTNDSVPYLRRTVAGTSSWIAGVPSTGGNFTGQVFFDQDVMAGDGGGTHQIAVNGGAGFNRDVRLMTNGAPRWIIRANDTAEGGSNAGSDLEILARDDTGAALSTPIEIERSTGTVRVNAPFIVNDTAADVDSRIEGTGDANLTYWDAGNNRVGIGTNSPAAWLDLSKSNATTSPITGLRVNSVFAPSSVPGSVFPSSFVVISDYDSTHSPSGGFQLAQFLNVRNVGNGTISTRCLDVAYSNLGNGTVDFATGLNVRTPVNSGGGAITTAYGIKIENQNVAGTNYAIYTDAGTVRFGDRVGVNVNAPGAMVSIDQSSTTGAIAVLDLDQGDVSEEFINFISAVGAGNPVDTAALGTYYGKVRVAVNGTFKYMALYNS